MSRSRNPCKEIPFRIDRKDVTPLVDQVVDGVRRAIASGFYGQGETLPSRREMAEVLGVSQRVPAEAMARLVKEGVIESRTRAGCRVLPKGLKSFRGRVLFVTNFSGGYYATQFASELRMRFARRGVLLETATFSEVDGYRTDYAFLDLILRQPFRLAVLFCDSNVAMRKVDAAGIPFVVIGSEHRYPNCVGTIRFNVGAAVPAFVRHCRKNGVSDVLQIGYAKEMSAGAVRELKEAGIRAERWTIPCCRGYGVFEGIDRSAMEAVLERFGRQKRHLPQLLYLPDDCMARGVLTALLKLGIRVPDDVKVVSFANAGLGPVFPISLTRLLMDPHLDGQDVARTVMEMLEGGTDVVWPEVGTRYIVGESFP